MSSKHEFSLDPGIDILNTDPETKQNIIEDTLLSETLKITSPKLSINSVV